MSKIQYYRYSLVPKSGGKPREGALLHVDGGYADLCPLPEFGDGTVDEQLALVHQVYRDAEIIGNRGLSSGNDRKEATFRLLQKNTYLVRCARYFAGFDARCRSERKTCFLEGIPPLENHALFPDLTGHTPTTLRRVVQESLLQGFHTFKVKVGRGGVEQETRLLNVLIESLPREIKLRLDPNARFTLDSCTHFLDSLTPQTHRCIEFMEDPTPFDALGWRSLYDRFGIAIAADFEGTYYRFFDKFDDLIDGPIPYQVRVIKPVRESMETILPSLHPLIKVAVTSALDHPVGQMVALYEAHQNIESVNPVCGIASHLVYEENPFSAQLRMEGSRLIPPPGTGWGFDELLEALPWTDLD